MAVLRGCNEPVSGNMRLNPKTAQDALQGRPVPHPLRWPLLPGRASVAGQPDALPATWRGALRWHPEPTPFRPLSKTAQDALQGPSVIDPLPVALPTPARAVVRPLGGFPATWRRVVWVGRRVSHAHARLCGSPCSPPKLHRSRTREGVACLSLRPAPWLWRLCSGSSIDGSKRERTGAPSAGVAHALVRD